MQTVQITLIIIKYYFKDSVFSDRNKQAILSFLNHARLKNIWRFKLNPFCAWKLNVLLSQLPFFCKAVVWSLWYNSTNIVIIKQVFMLYFCDLLGSLSILITELWRKLLKLLGKTATRSIPNYSLLFFFLF